MKSTHSVKEAVLLLHSSASSARQWDSLAALLEPAFRVRTVEFHGHGARLPWIGSTLGLADDAELALAELRDAGTAHVIGHSYGGAVALKAASMAPLRVRSLVVYEPVALRLLLDFEPTSQAGLSMVRIGNLVRHHLRCDDAAAAAHVFVDFWSGAGSWNSMSEHARRSIAARMAAVGGHFDALLAEAPDLNWIARAPIAPLFVTGSKTVPVTREIGALLRRLLPFARHEALPGAGHMGPLTHAAAFNSLVSDFLESQDPESIPSNRKKSHRLSTDSLLGA